VPGSADIAASVAAAVAGIVATVARGRLITIEGVDGAGKTTLAAALAEHLRGHGFEVELLREPGGVLVAEQIRALVKDPALAIGARAEALLFAAARAQLVEEAVNPTLERGAWVLLDRFVDSSLAYQGAGRGLGVEQIRALNEFGSGGLAPERTLLLDLDPAIGRARKAGGPKVADRLEREQDSFFATVAAAYAALAEAEPERVRRIDASQPAEAVLDDARAAVADLL
jgi:dTMP kinase